jgi:ElaB/YqjD/DUF883 family membrane-anchored ribosome-binding protein
MRYDYPSARQVAGRELREVVAATEALLQILRDESDPELSELRERLTVTIADVKKEMSPSVLARARESFARARDTAGAVHGFVQRRPWSSVAIGVGVGMLLGMLVRD